MEHLLQIMTQVIATHQVKNLVVILTIQSNNLAVVDIMIDWWNQQAPHIWKYKKQQYDSSTNTAGN